MAKEKSPRKRIVRTTTINPTEEQLHDDDNNSKKPRSSSSSNLEPSLDQPSPSIIPSSQRPKIDPLELFEAPLLDLQYIPTYIELYNPPSFIKEITIALMRDREFFDKCLIKLHQNDPTLLSINIVCEGNEDYGITPVIEALAVNTTLFELGILCDQMTLSEQFFEALKPNSTLTRLGLWYNPIDDALATQLCDLLRINTTLLSLNLCKTELTENGISQLCSALCVNTTLIHLDLREVKMNEGSSTSNFTKS